MSSFLSVLKSFSETIKNGLLMMLIYGVILAYSNTKDSAGDKFLFKYLIGNKKLVPGKDMREVAMEVFEESLIGVKLLFIIVGIVTSVINKDIYYGEEIMTLKNITYMKSLMSLVFGVVLTGIVALISKLVFKGIPRSSILVSTFVGGIFMFNTVLFSGTSANNKFIFETLLYGFFGGLSIGIMSGFRSSKEDDTLLQMASNGSTGFIMGFIFYYFLNIIFQFSGMYTIGELNEKDIFRTSKTNVNVKESFTEAFSKTRTTTTRKSTAVPPPKTSHKKKGIEALLGLKDGLFYSIIAIIALVMVYFTIISTVIREWPVYIPLYNKKPWLFIIETLAFILTNAIPTVYAMRLRKSKMDASSLFIVTFLQFALLQIILQGSGFYKYIFKPVEESSSMGNSYADTYNEFN